MITPTTELSYDTFEAYGVQESANRYDIRGEMLHGPIPSAHHLIAETEIVFRFVRQLPTASDLARLSNANFNGIGREFTGPRTPYN